MLVDAKIVQMLGGQQRRPPGLTVGYSAWVVGVTYVCLLTWLKASCNFEGGL
jgi:hypothetical protein